MTNPVMLITGASRGIGKATAMLAAQNGYDLLINYAREAEAAEAVAIAAQKHGVRAVIQQGDVAEPDDVDAMFIALDQSFGRLDVLVNNAGIVGQAGPLADADPEMIRRVFDVNILGSFLCAREAVKRMSTRFNGKGGVIINLSSIAATNGSPGEYVHYAASKGAIDSFTHGLALEVGREGIRVNAVQAGTVDTDIHHRDGNPKRPGMVARTAPLGRCGEPEDIAEAILWLASDKASYATGAVLRVGGGL